MITWFKIQPSKTKTFCLYHQKHKNLLSKSSKTSKPAVKTSKPSKPTVKIIKNIKTYCHLLYILQKQKPPVKIIKTSKHQNLLSKPSKPPVKIIKTSCQKHQNHLSKTSKPTVIIPYVLLGTFSSTKGCCWVLIWPQLFLCFSKWNDFWWQILF